MVEESKGTKKIKPEVLLSRFRSKEDLYRYLTQQGKKLTSIDSRYSECVSSINAWYKGGIHERHPQ